MEQPRPPRQAELRGHGGIGADALHSDDLRRMSMAALAISSAMLRICTMVEWYLRCATKVPGPARDAAPSPPSAPAARGSRSCGRPRSAGSAPPPTGSSGPPAILFSGLDAFQHMVLDPLIGAGGAAPLAASFAAGATAAPVRARRGEGAHTGLSSIDSGPILRKPSL